MATAPAALGRKRPQLDVNIERLHLDPRNPRLPEEVQGSSEADLLEHLLQNFDLDEIADPMGKNGYFDEEPLVVVPQKLPKQFENIKNGAGQKYLDYLRDPEREFTVVEGNRRLATAKLLLDESLRKKLKIRSWVSPVQEVRDDLAQLPAIVYPTRAEVLPYLGVRHIIGNKKWDSYAKARYIAAMLAEGHSIEDIEHEIGDHAQSVRKNAIAYNMLKEAAEEFDWDIGSAKADFSFMLLAIGQRNIKIFLGWTTKSGTKVSTTKLAEIPLDRPVPDTHVDNLHDLLVWMYGDKKKRPVINESRDITALLAPVVASPTAIEYLKTSGNLAEAYELTDGEESMLRKLLKTANGKLDKALGVAHRHKVPDVIADAEKCEETARRIVKTLVED